MAAENQTVKVKYHAEPRVAVAAFSSCPTPAQLQGLELQQMSTGSGKVWVEGSNKRHRKVQYKSTEITPGNDEAEGYRYLLGVVHGGSDRMHLHEVDGFPVSTTVEGIYEDLAARDSNNKQSSWDQKLALIQGFGAGKKKREMASMLAGKVTDDKIEDMADVKSALMSRGDELKMEKEGSSSRASELAIMRELLPPDFDVETNVPALIYKKDKMCPDHYLQLVDGSFYSSLISSPKKLEKEISEDGAVNYALLKAMCKLFADHTDSSQSSVRRTGKALQMLEWLIDLYRFCFMKPVMDENGRRMPTGKDGIPNSIHMMKAFNAEKKLPPPELCTFWLSQFKEAGASKKLIRKKLLCHMMVWAIIHTPKYTAPLGLLQKDLDDGQNKYVDRVAAYIGCEKRNFDADNWRLRAPLEVPEMRAKKKQKR